MSKRSPNPIGDLQNRSSNPCYFGHNLRYAAVALTATNSQLSENGNNHHFLADTLKTRSISLYKLMSYRSFHYLDKAFLCFVEYSKSQILSITINYKIPYWTSSANLRGPAEISSNLAISTKMRNLRRRQKALQI